MREKLTDVRWRVVSVYLLNGGVIREVGGYDRRRRSVGRNEWVFKKVVREEIMDSLKKMKVSKAAGLDGIVV